MTELALHTVRAERTSAGLLRLACLMIGAGGLLLGMQVDGYGRVVGTGYTALAIGGLVALAATLCQAAGRRRVPREGLTIVSAVMGFFGLASVISGVLAPGGTWLFCEVLVLLWILARRRSASQPVGPDIRLPDLVVLSLMLLFRLWITWQGSRHEWALVSVDVPLLARLPLPWLAPIQSVSLGSFSPTTLGFPAGGLDFPMTLGLWSTGFALAAGGLFLRHVAGREHENDRIHALIQSLPAPAAALVERILPEDRWEELGLHGLPRRLLAKRIEALVGERLQGLRELRGAFAVAELSGLSGAGPFAHSMLNVLGSYNEADPLLVRPREAAVLTAGDREAREDDAAHEH